MMGHMVPAASDYAGRLDVLMASFTALVALLSLPVFLLIFIFAVRYRRSRPANREHRPRGNFWLEISWSLIPFLAVLVFFVVATRMYFDIQRPPEDALVVNVVAKQWMWKFQHPEGQREINTLHVPAGEPVKLVMSSDDVIHSLFLPALRIKQDVLPGRYTRLWFVADRPGTYKLLCAEYCGTDHSKMGGSFVVMRPADYSRWLASAVSDPSPALAGAALYKTLGCAACHEDRASRRAPPLAGLYRSRVPLAAGARVLADEQYIRDSIVAPNQALHAGYRPIMPSYRNLVDAEELDRLVSYVKSLRGEREGAQP